ncbi:MAG: MBL fold metallo-hydrolase [Cyanobacteria bacterium P01_D01_bin.56]
MVYISYDFFRNVTAKLTYSGQTLLLDPMLSKKGALPSFAGIVANPTIDLPVEVESILEGVDAVLVSHMHVDHFDAAAAEQLAKDK